MQVTKAPISGQDQLKEIETKLESPPNLPEMLFGSNKMVLTHDASGTEV